MKSIMIKKIATWNVANFRKKNLTVFKTLKLNHELKVIQPNNHKFTQKCFHGQFKKFIFFRRKVYLKALREKNYKRKQKEVWSIKLNHFSFISVWHYNVSWEENCGWDNAELIHRVKTFSSSSSHFFFFKTEY